MKITKKLNLVCVLLTMLLLSACNKKRNEDGLLVITPEEYPQYFDVEELEPMDGRLYGVSFSEGEFDVEIPLSCQEGIDLMLKENDAGEKYINQIEEEFVLQIPSTYEGSKVIYACGITNNEYVKEIIYEDGVLETGLISGCPNLQEIKLPSTLEALGGLLNCDSIKGLDFSGCTSLHYIGNIEGCDSLTELDVPGSCEILGGVITNASLTRIVLNSGVKYIRSCGSSSPALEEVVLPDTLLYISGMSFSWSENLKELDVPDSVVFISEPSFCGIEQCKITLGKGTVMEETAKSRGLSYEYH